MCFGLVTFQCVKSIIDLYPTAQNIFTFARANNLALPKYELLVKFHRFASFSN